ncbi:MAG: YeeE/YedE thiosulfate transporter family protein [Actinomycetota bacterium]|nr:YeeE/YedE thiosulfate transporter family protein [Actinomycetota bacterium]
MTVTAPPPTRRWRRIRVTGLQAGIVLALVGVGLGAFFEVRPPDAYGVCMACHGRDLANSVVNSLFGSRLTVAPAAMVFPLLTVVGVVIGAFIAAVVSREFRWRRPSQPMRSFTYGVVVMNAALLAAACSIRLLLRTAAGDVLGLIGFLAMGVGVVLATMWLRQRALR